jgi:uncharacterized protein (TIGR04255 family)
MDEAKPDLLHPPIVEAVLDIDCDLPRDQDLTALEMLAREKLGDEYPRTTRHLLQEHRIDARPDASETSFSSRASVQAIRFHQTGEKQLVQVRALGYSFNRLAPYTSLDDYLPEIERTWRVYLGLAHPGQVRQVRLRFINRIELPMQSGRVDLDQYLRLGPRLPDEDRLELASFFNQYTAVDAATGLQVNVTLTTQPAQDGKLPLIFDNSAQSLGPIPPPDWEIIVARIGQLRVLKNRVFRDTLTERCLDLFQTP